MVKQIVTVRFQFLQHNKVFAIVLRNDNIVMDITILFTTSTIIANTINL